MNPSLSFSIWNWLFFFFETHVLFSQMLLCLCWQLQVLVEGRAKSRAAILNRPSDLNALTIPMVFSLLTQTTTLFVCGFVRFVVSVLYGLVLSAFLKAFFLLSGDKNQCSFYFIVVFCTYLISRQEK